jgi:hypothetical protein
MSKICHFDNSVEDEWEVMTSLISRTKDRLQMCKDVGSVGFSNYSNVEYGT